MKKNKRAFREAMKQKREIQKQAFRIMKLQGIKCNGILRVNEAKKVVDEWLASGKKIPFFGKPNKPSTIKTEFYYSDEWRALRYEAFKRYGRKCLVCRASPESGAVLHIDHIKPRSLYPELELDINNLQVLCEDCNLGKSNRDSIDWREKKRRLQK